MCVLLCSSIYLLWFCGSAGLIVGGVGVGVLVTLCRSHFTFVCFVFVFVFWKLKRIKKQLAFKTSNCTADAVIPFVLAHDPAIEADHSNEAQSSMVLMSPFVVC